MRDGLLHCVAAHEDKLSCHCEYALYKAGSLLKQLSMVIVYVARCCETEIAALCGDVQIGEGRVLACLEARGGQLGEDCKKAIAETTEQ